ncbi:type II secretion system F family protein, partial [Kineococcus glutinatus]|uniref:type II secretion system F family protein n=1 Tax=Kineococcus glutinatus TaxID=1070872 RepID=UPI0031EC457B
LRGLQQLLAPFVADAAGQVERVLGGAASVRRRLDAAGSGLSVAQFRAEQVLWGLAGAAVGAVLGVLLVASRGGSPVPALLLWLLATAGGVLGRDWALTGQADRRRARVLAEFPAVAELLALSVGAGEGAVAALERVGRTCTGEVAAELRRVLGEVRAGVPLVVALEAFAVRCDAPVVSRFVDAVVVAVERGTPLGDVLRAQAQDVREAGYRRLVEAGGRKEVLMLVPVVLLVLPVTVLFAVYPGLVVLRLGP